MAIDKAEAKRIVQQGLTDKQVAEEHPIPPDCAPIIRAWGEGKMVFFLVGNPHGRDSYWVNLNHIFSNLCPDAFLFKNALHYKVE